ncbi:D-2-hydroxyacid dehydrogenase [Virgibacillus xinjiangensis]|uniref:D-2-hydroxyacid dehydrogenase n=1 Tax=Virgibacillus xinjiangensis TaxID=393090 RepID=A0ABV7CS10_9BACI
MILFSAKISQRHQDRLKETYPDLEIIFSEGTEDTYKYIEEAEVLVTYGSELEEKMIERAGKLEWMMVLSAGVDKMPFQAVKDKGIPVTNARGIHKIQMSEYAISMLLQVYRGAKQLAESERKHHWDRSVKMREMTGRTLLIAGTGAIGQEVARLAKAFQMKTIGISRSGRSKEYFDETYENSKLDDLLPEVDAVVSVLPSTEETRGFYKEKHFQMLPDHAVFLNMGRGDAVKEEVLLEAVRKKEIDHVILDVFEEEPLPENHPFWEEERVTITPHLAGMSPNYTTRALEVFEKNLKVYLDGKNDYINLVDMDRGY